MKIIIAIIFIILLCVRAQADIFDKNLSNQDQVYSSVSKDKSSYYYQAHGLDYNLPQNATPIQVGAKTNFKLGCSGFDFNTSFLKEFNVQALKNDVVSQAQQVMAAAPLLLLDYASPSLADMIKHFQALANGKLGLDIMSCQQIESAVDDKFDKMRKESEKECLNDNSGMGMSAAMDFCKNQTDPFSFLKDISGNPLSSGGQINVVKDTLQRLGVSSDESYKMLNVMGDTQITKSGYRDTGRLIPYETMIQQNKDQNMTSFEDIVVAYQTNNTVSDADLKPFSRPGVQINTNFLSNLLLLPKDERTMVVSKLASYWAYLDTNEIYRKAIDYYNAGISDPNTGSLAKDILRDKKDKAEFELSKAKEHYQELTDLKDIIASVNTDADISRAKLIDQLDGTQMIGADEREQVRQKGLLNNF